MCRSDNQLVESLFYCWMGDFYSFPETKTEGILRGFKFVLSWACKELKPKIFEIPALTTRSRCSESHGYIHWKHFSFSHRLRLSILVSKIILCCKRYVWNLMSCCRKMTEKMGEVKGGVYWVEFMARYLLILLAYILLVLQSTFNCYTEDYCCLFFKQCFWTLRVRMPICGEQEIKLVDCKDHATAIAGVGWDYFLDQWLSFRWSKYIYIYIPIWESEHKPKNIQHVNKTTNPACHPKVLLWTG